MDNPRSTLCVEVGLYIYSEEGVWRITLSLTGYGYGYVDPEWGPEINIIN